jgi:TonB family protein
VRQALLISSLLHLVLLLSSLHWGLPFAPGFPAAQNGRLTAHLVPISGQRRSNAEVEGGVGKSVRLGQGGMLKPPAASQDKSAPGVVAGLVGTQLEVDTARLPSKISAEGRNSLEGGELSLVDAEELRLYRFSVARTAGRFKRYPEAARERGWEGVVTVMVSLSPGTQGVAVSLARSSGYEALDRQALEMLGESIRHVSPPVSLLGRGFSFSVPVRYSLDE